ncbi:hypothetical protein LMH87_002067 [Akanthomyces muscarius]|uniref:Uncharacterized protein n=2 Tax=Akanthomyces TaxID=150366 RepID=A0A168FHH4_CORDF|nr:hypothetical protein LMH87_002067 [Akanthomyces muscarius]KAJ4147555.1 hypothetical protein LMH87_002067 [Akanthomyces muscarius]OAA75194.1 hypothetical protein LEL_07182 [Akanthomyces lecanii RCEF 1005]
MKFTILSILPILIAASSLGDREASVMSNDRPTVDVKDIKPGAKLDVLELKTSDQKGFATSAVYCPPGYPKYCPRYNFCCPAIAQACCPRACCRSAGGFCGSDGLCYI